MFRLLGGVTLEQDPIASPRRAEHAHHLGEGTGQTDLLGSQFEVRGAPHRNGRFLGAQLVFDRWHPGFAHVFYHGDQGRQGQLPDFSAFIGLTGDLQMVLVRQVQTLDAGGLGEIEKGGHFRSHLGGVAIDRLLAADHQVHRVQLLHRRRQGGGGGPGIGAGESAIAQQHSLVHPARHHFTQRRFRLRRPHGDHGDLRPVPIFQAQGRFRREQIERIDDRFDPLAYQGVGVRINAHVLGVRYLFDTNHDMHGRGPAD